jgi:hypothetical protein
MEKRKSRVLSEDQKKRVNAETQVFLKTASEFIRKESELHNCEKNIKTNNEKLSRVAEEERQMDAAMEVLYGEVKKEAATRKIKEEIEALQKEWKILSEELDQLRTHLLKQMRNLPIPVNLEEPKKEEANMIFSFFDEAKFGEEGIKAICMLLRQERPLSFSDMTLLPDGIIVKASEKQEALRKLIDGIKSFRMRVDDLLKSYEQIDTMVERVRKSELYSGVLRVLSEKGKLSSDAIAKALNMDKRKVYDTCYNLTRSNWSPNPIRTSPSGEWELTLPGEILVNRLVQKSGEYGSEKNT